MDISNALSVDDILHAFVEGELLPEDEAEAYARQLDAQAQASLEVAQARQA